VCPEYLNASRRIGVLKLFGDTSRSQFGMFRSSVFSASRADREPLLLVWKPIFFSGVPCQVCTNVVPRRLRWKPSTVPFDTR
jgi:hypothetical protein